jgi:hypothetical protein
MPRGIPIERIAFLEAKLSAQLTADDHAAAAGFLHFCDDWDFMLIDKNDPEFECCSCIFGPEYDSETGKLTNE